MTPLQYVRAIGRFWYLVALGVVLGLVGASAVSSLPGTSYESSATVVVGATPLGNETQAAAYTTNLLAQDRMLTFLSLAEGPTLEEAVLDQLGGGLSASELRDHLEFSVPTDSTVMAITATDEDADRAQAITTAAAEAMVGIINQQENRRGPENALLRAGLRTPATEPTVAAMASAAWRTPLLGGAGGLVLGLLLAVAAARLDPRGHADSDVSDALEAPVLGSVSGSPVSFGPVGRGSRAGTPAWESMVRRLRTYVVLDRHGAEAALTLALTGVRDVPETSRLAVDLGTALVDGGATVLVVDCDTRGRVGDLLGIHRGEGSGAVADEVHRHDSGVDVLVGSSSVSDAEDRFLSPAFVDLLDEARSRYDFVLLPTSAPSRQTEALAVAARSDGVVVVARRHGRTSSAREVARQLRTAGARLRGVVVLP